jgi:hypothetical protein
MAKTTEIWNHYGSTYDSIIAQILDEKEGKSIPEGEGSF